MRSILDVADNSGARKISIINPIGGSTGRYARLGDIVTEGQPLLIIEAMKVFTDIPADVSGKIVEVMAKNGQPVEYGQALFRVAPA